MNLSADERQRRVDHMRALNARQMEARIAGRKPEWHAPVVKDVELQCLPSGSKADVRFAKDTFAGQADIAGGVPPRTFDVARYYRLKEFYARKKAVASR